MMPWTIQSRIHASLVWYSGNSRECKWGVFVSKRWHYANWFFNEKTFKNSNHLHTEKLALGKWLLHTVSVFNWWKKTEGKGLSVTRKSARLNCCLDFKLLPVMHEWQVPLAVVLYSPFWEIWSVLLQRKSWLPTHIHSYKKQNFYKLPYHSSCLEVNSPKF